MEQLIRHVTTSITDQLPGDKSFFTPDDLREYDIPEFLVQRVEVEIYRNLNESIVPPHSEWADMSAANVEHAWEQFIDAIVAEVRMPASFVPSVFETAIADVVEMILHPRQAIPAILFGPKKTLTAEEVEKRLSFISVNSHLGQAILKYMIRKGKTEVELGTAKNVVMKVDERITANYNSLNWAQLLQPLFILAGPKIDTEMFRVFFKDRNMDRISRRFDLLNGSLNKTEFIEILSSPDLLNEEGYEDDQVSLFDVEPGPRRQIEPEPEIKGPEAEKEFSSSVSTLEKDDEAHKNEAEVSEKAEMKSPDEKTEDEYKDQSEIAEDQDEEDSLLGSFQNRHRESGDSEDEESAGDDEDLQTDAPWFVNDEDEEEKGDEPPLYSRFDEDIDETTEQVEEEPDRLADRFSSDDVEESEEDSEEKFSVLFQEDEKVEREEDDYTFSIEEKNTSEDDSSLESNESYDLTADDTPDVDNENPIWQSFLGDEDHIEEDDIPEYSGFADLDETEDEEFENEEEPLIDLTVQDEEESAEELIEWLKDDEHRFTDRIFSGSDAAYEQALLELKKFDDWKQASRFIEKEIFARNLVDMYDEEAVDFTDRMQAYFDEFKS